MGFVIVILQCGLSPCCHVFILTFFELLKNKKALKINDLTQLAHFTPKNHKKINYFQLF